MLRRSRLLLALPLLAAAAFPASCGSSDRLTDANPPDDSQGTGGLTPPGAGGHFDPGDGGPGSYGANSNGANGPGTGGAGGAGGQTTVGGMDGGTDASGEPAPPMCTDDLKRCAHEFTYPAGTETSVELRGDFAPGAWTMGAPMTKSGGMWRVTVAVPYGKPVQYKFFVDGTTWQFDPANPTKTSDGMNSQLSAITCTDFTCDMPPALGYDWRDAILYFVFVDRFKNGDPSNDGTQVASVNEAANYQGGDYAGVLAKINDGYFTDLGINTLWLTVPMDNPEESGVGTDGMLYSAYHGYWPMNLDQTEERFGSLAELKGVVDAAHAKGIKVILDYAMNHVHQSSPVYAMHPDWFWPNSFMGHDCNCGMGCSWDDPEQARRCWFAPYLPDFNFTVPEARKFSVDNAIDWVKNTGVDGLRLDAVKHIETSWISDLRARVTSDIEPTSKQHFYMVGETFTGDQGLIKSFVDPQTLLDGQFDFPLRVQLTASLLIRKGAMSDVDGFLANNENFYGSGVMSTFIGNHDVPRAIHFAEDTPVWTNEWADGKDKAWSGQPSLPSGTSAFQRLGNAFTILFTTKGIPLVYYGDEIGMAGAGDPDNRQMMTFDNYTDGQKLLLGVVKKLTQIRAAHPALRRGAWKSLGSSADTLAYSMTYNGDTVVVAVNRSDNDQSVGGLPSATMTDQLTGTDVTGPSVTVPARSSLVLVAK